MRRKKSLGSIIFGLLVAGVVWLLQENGILDKDGSSGGGAKVPTADTGSTEFTQVQTQDSDWTYLAVSYTHLTLPTNREV